MLQVGYKNVSGRLGFRPLRNLPRHRVVFSELAVDEQNTFKLQFPQSTFVSIPSGLELLHRGFPFAFHFFVTESAEAHTPALENDNLYRWLTLLVDNFPGFRVSTIALTRMGGFIVEGDADILLAGEELGEDIFAEGNVVGGGLTAVLD